MKTNCIRDKQMEFTQKLQCYSFKIDHHLGTKNSFNKLSRPLINKNSKKKLVEQNREILNKLQHFSLRKNYSLFHPNHRAIILFPIFGEENYF